MRRFLYVSLALIPLIPGVCKAHERVIWNPPERFDHLFHGRTEIIRIPYKEVWERCNNKAYGCVNAYPTLCYIFVINKPRHGISPEAVIRHEMGHCNGWPANHPD